MAAPAPAPARGVLPVHVWRVDVVVAVERLLHVTSESALLKHSRPAVVLAAVGGKRRAKVQMQVGDAALDVAHALHEVLHAQVASLVGCCFAVGFAIGTRRT